MQYVQFAENSLGVTAHVLPPLPTGRLSDLTVPLAKRDVDFATDFKTRDFVEAVLPDGSYLIVGPTFDNTDHDLTVPGPQNGWYIDWSDPHTGTEEVLYNSRPGYADQQHGTDVAPMLAALGEHLDRHGVPTEQAVQDRWNRAESLLHRAGFVEVTTGTQQSHHRLPSAMIDTAERRAAVTQAIDYLRAEGFGYDCPADLVDQEAAPAVLPSRSLAQVRDAIAQARHTSQVADALGELTAPGDGVLDQTVGLLRETASWWEGLGRGVDPHYAGRLRYIADIADGYATEVRAMRGDLTDRHAQHPGRSRSTEPAATPAEARVIAALAASPAATRTPIGRHADAAPAATAVPVRPAVPSR